MSDEDMTPLEKFIFILAAFCNHREIGRLLKFFTEWEKQNR